MGEDAVEVITDGGAESLEWALPTPSRPADPGLQCASGAVGVTIGGEDIPQAFLQAPRTGSLQAGMLRPVHVGELVRGPVAGVLQGAPADALDIQHVLDLGAADPLAFAVAIAGDAYVVGTVWQMAAPAWSAAALVQHAAVRWVPAADYVQGMATLQRTQQQMTPGALCFRIVASGSKRPPNFGPQTR